jgi:hypothetical protein
VIGWSRVTVDAMSATPTVTEAEDDRLITVLIGSNSARRVAILGSVGLHVQLAA